MNDWKSGSHHNYLLQYHLIFVCKYRKRLLSNKYITDNIKLLSQKICNKHKVVIKYIKQKGERVK
ncbi:transposase [Granulicatella balaenopterae]|uniref:transposase n=1 Tax=Granulicatella balaenopterae TaxID=137733 RepID=UPI000B7D35BF